MWKNSQEIDRILEAKFRIAGDRDLLQNMLRYLKERIERLTVVYKKRKHRSLGKQLKRYRAIAGSIMQAIAAKNAMIKSASDNKILRSFKNIYRFLVDKIFAIKKSCKIFAFKFRGIYFKCDEMVANVTELKRLIAA